MLWVWGNNTAGTLGTLDRVHRSSPVQIPGTIWCWARTGDGTTVAIKTDGTLWAWGCSNNGQLGQNSGITDISSPVQIPGTTWCKVSTGGNAVGAINWLKKVKGVK